MLHNELRELESCIDDVNSGLERVYRVINNILSHPSKNYDLTFKKEVFNLTPPFSIDDERRLQKMRRRYITLIMNHVLKERVNKLVGDPDYFPKEVFEMWYALSYGEDPLDHQLDRTVLSGIYEVGDDEHGNQRPLDEDSYQVKLQDVKKVKGEDFAK